MSGKPFETEIAEMMQAIGLLVRRVRASAAGQELSMTESSVIGRLARHGAATTADLARAEAIKPQSMGTTIASLEELGIVGRKPHPTDGRQMLIELTAKGEAIRRSAREAKQSWLADAVSQLDSRDQETLFAAVDILKRLAEQ
jgi:DNA-binding MarR family transcriptional regulator